MLREKKALQHKQTARRKNHTDIVWLQTILYVPLFVEKMVNIVIFYCTLQFSLYKTLEPNLHQLSLS
jgi:hypothetical protein